MLQIRDNKLTFIVLHIGCPNNKYISDRTIIFVYNKKIVLSI